MSHSTVKKVKLNFIFGVLAQIITLGIGILIPRLFIVSYGSEVNGYINSINQIFVYVALLEAGVGSAATQALYAPVGKEEQRTINGIMAATNRFYKRTAFMYLFVVVALSFVYPLLVESSLSYNLMVGIFLINGGSGVVAYFCHAKYKLLLNVDGRGYVTSAIATIYQVLLAVGKAVLLLLGFDVLVVQSAYLILNVLQAVFFWIYVKKHYCWLDLKTVPDTAAISKSRFAMVHQVSGLIFNNTDVLILTFFCDLKMVSVYALYKTLIGMVGTLVTHFSSSINFKLGQIFEDRERFLKLHDAFETFHITLTFSLCTVAYLLFRPFLQVYTEGMDANYLLTYMPLLMVLVEVLSFIRLPSQNVITFAGHFKETQWRSLLESGINLASSLVLVIAFERLWGLGIYGVLIGTIVALFYRTNDILLYTNRKILKRSSKGVYITCLINIVMTVAVVCIYRLVAPALNGYISVIITAVILCVIIVPTQMLVCFAANKPARQYAMTFLTGLRKKNG